MTEECQCGMCRKISTLRRQLVDEKRATEIILARAKYAAEHSIKSPPPDDLGSWKDFLPENDA